MHRFTLTFLLASVLLSLVSMPLEAATFQVNSTADVVDASPGNGVCETTAGNGVCTLRAAIQEANALLGADAIELPAGTYQLVWGPYGEGYDHNAAMNDLDITDDLTLTGAGVATTIVNGPRTESGVSDRVFEIVGPVAVHISGVTIQNGSGGNGGGIANGGDETISGGNLTLTEVIIAGEYVL